VSYEFKLPDIGEGVAEGEIIKWHVKEGETVKEEQPLVEVMTDKVNAVIPSPVSGRVTALLAKEGDKVKVGQTVLIIQTGSDQPVIKAPVQKNAEAIVEKETTKMTAEPAQLTPRRVLATPAVRKLARELGVDIEDVKGSGPSGRVTEADVRSYAKSLGPLGSRAESSEKLTEQGTEPSQYKEEASSVTAKIQRNLDALEERVPLRGLRRSVAEKMTKSAYTIPHVSHFDEVDVTELVKLRELFKTAAESKGIKLTYLPFIIKALCMVLKEYPYLNASLDEQKQEIVLKKYYNIGVATAVENGLIVPVIHDADKRNLFELAAEINRLSENARQNRLALSDVQGGTFSVTSIGSIGGTYATPIINYPEAAILGLYKITKKPVFDTEGVIEARDVMNVSLTFDHRILDGAVAASFVNRLKKLLEDPRQLVSYLL
jgi:pyruvate/2-oxoglutarate dehydrogenase complex dihydrolipoamide acyltransferase (E2) component